VAWHLLFAKMIHYSRMQKSKSSAFSLVELMIIVAILSDVLIVAMPAFLRARNLSQNTKFMNDLRTAAAAFEMYSAENNRYPAPAGPGTIPSGMGPYLSGTPWSSVNSIGCSWVWQPTTQTSTAAIGVTSPVALDDLRMLDIDIRLDNGVSSTGSFRKIDERNYFYILEP
jgi:type II secretory pathway pseudopilin PulG